MIVVDTNVWSEPLRPEPDPEVVAWLRAISRDLVMPAIVVHELKYGVELLPPGRRRDLLDAQVNALIDSLRGRVLDYTSEIATVHARLRATARGAGHEPSAQDGEIAAHALHLSAPLATRNTNDFTSLGVDLIDPWQPTAPSSRA